MNQWLRLIVLMAVGFIPFRGHATDTLIRSPLSLRPTDVIATGNE